MKTKVAKSSTLLGGAYNSYEIQAVSLLQHRLNGFRCLIVGVSIVNRN